MKSSYELNGRYIVVLTNGWVFVGTLEKLTEEDAKFSNAANIRTWGTTRGLGELANNGATNSTVLDPCGKLVARHSATLFVIPVTADF